jgi:predicted  nucleic acid-binding Zn-ribbon protein
MAAETKKEKEITVEEKLRALFQLQNLNSEVDKIRTLRGELPLEVQDLEDEIAGLQTRVDKYKEEVKSLEHQISTKENEIAQAESAITKYKDQQNNVRNNREFDSLSKEIEYQTLEIELYLMKSLQTQKKKRKISSIKLLISNQKLKNGF